jgi:hypothetical protein
MIKEKLISIAKKFGIKDTKVVNRLYKESLEVATKMLGNIKGKEINNFVFIKDIFIDIANRHKENDIMNTNKDLLQEYINSDLSIDDLLKEYETSDNVRQVADKSSLPGKKKKTKGRAEEESKKESEEDLKV